ncbi:MAG: hypothetical protein IJ523_10490 [Succinivibrionaceae bacterium]|nr:hypothetical protein [Succinivibrionaceae bacterium]
MKEKYRAMLQKLSDDMEQNKRFNASVNMIQSIGLSFDEAAKAMDAFAKNIREFQEKYMGGTNNEMRV